MAYAALASLARAIDQILPHDQVYSFLCVKDQMKSLYEKVVLLQELVEYIAVQSSSSTIDDLPESQIRDVAYQLEDIIESIICRPLGQEFESDDLDTQLPTLGVFCDCFEKVGVLLEEAMKIKKNLENKDIPRALASLARAIDQILPQDQDYAFLCGKEQMKSLHGKVILLQKSLEDISGQSHSSTIDAPESRITNVVYQLEDIMEFIRCGSRGQDVDKREFHRCFEEVDVLLVEAMEMEKNLGKKNIPRELYTLTTRSSQRETTSAKDNVGLNEDVIEILDRIIGQGSNIQIVPITGMGGIGKTTLARAVYESSATVNHFDVRVWVTVSVEFRIEDIFRGILTAKQQKEVPNKKLFDSVHQRLIKQRYLIVLDDMWHKEVWDEVRRAFPNDNNGSRVILTTRLLEVAKYVATSSDVHERQLLNEDQSWTLLQQKVYGQEHCPTEFEDIGRTISKSCKGLPLALVVIGGLLKFNKAKDYWEKVARNTNAEAASTEYDNIFGILSLSYTNLPCRLKACFLYMGAFKEDYEIPTKELAMLWTSEGFLKKPKESKPMEEVAEECLEELVERSLVLVTKRGYSGKIKTSSVHDVLREVSLRKAQEERFLHYFTAEDMNEVSFRKVIKVQRRVSFSTHKLFNFPHDTYDALSRSVLNKYPMTSRRLSIILRFRLLRVLDRVYIEDASNLTTLFRLTNLRYLHFVRKETYSPLNVPESISNLQNLETLIFSARFIGDEDRYELVLPSEIWKMPRLRHLVMIRKSSLLFPELSQGYHPVLENLQTLSWVTNLDLSRTVVEKIPNIKKLRVEYRVITKDDKKHFHLDNLVHLHQLEKLAVWGETWGPQIRKYAFPHNLKKLTLERTGIPWRNMSSIVGKLPYLEKLKLMWFSVTGKEWEPNEGEFLQLKYLKMDDLVIENWRAESTHFPRLETLVIVSCGQLNEIPSGIGEIDTLNKLIVKDCKYVRDSVEEIQEEQLNYGDAELQVNVSDDEDFLPQLF